MNNIIYHPGGKVAYFGLDTWNRPWTARIREVKAKGKTYSRLQLYTQFKSSLAKAYEAAQRPYQPLTDITHTTNNQNERMK